MTEPRGTMKYDCKLIKEIIPFKQNDIAIDGIVSEHLSECKSCRATYKALVIGAKRIVHTNLLFWEETIKR